MLKYYIGYPVIRTLSMCSRSSRRVYCSAASLSFARKRDLGALILSTNRGVLSDATAVKLNVGGEILVRVN